MFNATNYEICKSALRKVGAIGEDDTPSTFMMENALFLLNSIIKEAHVDGMPLWRIQELILPCSLFTDATYTFSVEEDSPLKVLQGVIRDHSNPTQPYDIPMIPLTRYNYNTLPTKHNVGMPVQYFYNPETLYGVLKIWPAPDTYSITNRSVVLTAQMKFEDTPTSAEEILDFPSYWNRALIYQLATTLAPEYGYPVSDRQLLAAEAAAFWNRALSFGGEEGSLFLQVDPTVAVFNRG